MGVSRHEFVPNESAHTQHHHLRRWARKRPLSNAERMVVVPRDERQQQQQLVDNQDKNNTNILVGPNCWDCFDDLLLFSVFRDTLVYPDKGYHYGRAESVTCQVLTTILRRDHCDQYYDDFLYSDDSSSSEESVGGETVKTTMTTTTTAKLSKRPERSFFVGRVAQSSEESSFPRGTLVTSLQRCPLDAKFVTLPVDALIPLSPQTDVAEAVATLTYFLPARGMLRRVETTTLKGIDVLVTGGGTDEADAVVSLALLGGANRVFVLQSALSLASWHATSVRVELMSDDPDEWLPLLQNRLMDLIVDLDYPHHFDELYSILKRSGHLVCQKPRQSRIEDWWHEAVFLSYPNASLYDLQEQIKDHYPELVRDLRYLFGLLQKRKIRPKIDQYTTVAGIEAVQEAMRRQPGSGAVICEPWRERKESSL